MSYPKGRPDSGCSPVLKRHAGTAALIIALILPLAGCATSDDTAATVVTAPGQYDLYDCPAIKVAAAAVVTRQAELEKLMARASRGPAGGLVNATTYEPEYATQRGKMEQLRRVAAEKHCGFDPAALPVPTVQSPPPKRRTR